MIKQTSATLLVLIVTSTLSACQYEELNRSEFMSPNSGNAIAHNSALQIIDPWPRTAGNNNLQVPATKYGGEPKTNASSPSPIVLSTGNAKQ